MKYILSGQVLKKCVCTPLDRIANIPSAVKRIGDKAFEGCTGLYEINIHSGVTSLGQRAFASCEQLKEISIPGSIENVGHTAFIGCASLKSVKINEGVKIIGSGAFMCCPLLKKISVPSSLEAIGEKILSKSLSVEYNEYDNALYIGNDSNPYLILALAKNPDIEKCEVHKDTRFILDSAFSGCQSLISVRLRNGITWIGNEAFKDCIKLKDINLPDSVRVLGTGVFWNCRELKKIVLPSFITSVTERMFEGCISLENINFSGNITEIGIAAFSGCKSLSSVNLSETIDKIPGYAFFGCSSLAEISIPASCKSVGPYAFYSCMSLSRVHLYEGLKEVEKNAFAGTMVKDVILPSSVSSVGLYAFGPGFSGYIEYSGDKIPAKDMKLFVCPDTSISFPLYSPDQISEFSFNASVGYGEYCIKNNTVTNQHEHYVNTINRNKAKLFRAIPRSLDFLKFLIREKLILYRDINTVMGIVEGCDNVDFSSVFLSYSAPDAPSDPIDALGSGISEL